MMKKLYISVIAILLAMLTGCTQYNGHIGPIFGSWSLVGMTKNGAPVDLESETVFSFQNELVRVIRLAAPGVEDTTRFGNFTIEGNVLTMRFQSKPSDSGNYSYITPNWLNFPLDGRPMHFDVHKLNGSKMELTLDNDGTFYGYSFKKTW